ncbi:MAG: DUF6714 family protein [Acidobacteriota bacterium]
MPLVDEIKNEIKAAFAGVTLDGGISLNQTKVVDNYGRDCTNEQFAALPLTEVTDNWTKIPTSTLDEANCLAHFDRKGFKYYIPALMLRLLDNYDVDSMMTIGTLSILYPKVESWQYLYSLLSPEQTKTVAHYLQALPTLVELYGGDKPVVERAFRNYWSKFLSEK